MKVRIPKTASWRSTEYLGGIVHDLPEHEALGLIEVGLAEAVKETKPKKKKK